MKQKKTSGKTTKKPVKNIREFAKKTENDYNKAVSFLLKEIKKAELERDPKKLRATRDVCDAWATFFGAVGEELAKSESAGKQRKFADDQIIFFKLLSREIDNRLQFLKAKDMERVLA
ncbi:MAG: hypothetical protein JW727_04475 [Candidatus Aenigmarchaeota archaeon]|nr:hypothetical protein [Candidatus Aenigmarchaeota archaeon]